MAQHDYTINNASGAAVRTDLNSALSAIATANSGATAPATTYSYQLWADTGTTKLRIRNGANSAWIEIGDLGSTNLGLLVASRFPQVTGNVTASHTELNKLDGCNATTAQLNELVGVTNIVQSLAGAYPVGSIYMNASNSTNPATLLGFGIWSSFGAGRVLVGLDSTQSEFNSIGETGGSKTHQLSVSEMPAHTHTEEGSTQADEDTGWYGGGATGNVYNAENTGSTGGNAAHNNLQPYITVYMWKRDS
jgi:hypothetical protein